MFPHGDPYEFAQTDPTMQGSSISRACRVRLCTGCGLVAQGGADGGDHDGPLGHRLQRPTSARGVRPERLADALVARSADVFPDWGSVIRFAASEFGSRGPDPRGRCTGTRGSL
ncbi:hypothetical protein SVIO_106880 [Streptomyces violaceusniger]|uniref:Uncharacterized protein n=1 Tax=Streptomyces violaceusniger TaxID=68280 RepID=A0A4D4LGD9_STRVO|nr:hypothetical protein SVIO_106880 [Streptomyces violaceusniger]